MMIVLDGPAGSGKSSTARAVADRLGLQYLDSGALYRAFTLAWLDAGGGSTFFDRLDSVDVGFDYRDGVFQVDLAGRDVTGAIRSPRVNDSVSLVAAEPRVRSLVNSLMRDRARKRACIADGRDLGTVVFPDAELKIYMDASPEVRAQRRTLELQRGGQPVRRDDVLESILQRDRLDSTREADPLRMAPDAVRVDTDRYGFEEQVDHVVRLVKDRIPDGSPMRGATPKPTFT